MNYVWDFGGLNKDQEWLYINAIIADKIINFYDKSVMSNILQKSHDFMKELEDQSSVSLRDMNRFK